MEAFHVTVKLAWSAPNAEVWASNLPDLPTMFIDVIPEKVPKAAETPLIVAEHEEKPTVPKFASLVMLPPIDGRSAMHSAEDLAAPLADADVE